MTEEEHPKIIHLHKPTQCVLWEQPNRIAGKFVELLEEVESYEDGSHLTRSLYKCRECGQLYFHEWYEWVDWKEGKDKIYTTLIPVQTPAEIEALKQTDNFTLLMYFPRLQLDGGKPRWMVKTDPHFRPVTVRWPTRPKRAPFDRGWPPFAVESAKTGPDWLL